MQAQESSRAKTNFLSNMSHDIRTPINRLNRVLLNLTSNAYKFTPEGGRISITLNETNCVENHGFYELRVKLYRNDR